MDTSLIKYPPKRSTIYRVNSPIRLFSTQVNIRKLNPWFISGFTDAEGSFLLEIRRDSTCRAGWLIVARFSITLHQRDLELLQSIQAYFGGVGRISTGGKNTLSYRINSQMDIKRWVLPHFDRYPLITEKQADYLLFREAVKLVSKKVHLTIEGINTIVGIRASLNKGLTPALKEAFPNCVPSPRPLVVDLQIQHPEWVAGFTSGEGCFTVSKVARDGYKSGGLVTLRFVIVQHFRCEQLMESLSTYFGCGKYYAVMDRDHGEFRVHKFSDIIEKIIPFFQTNRIVGVKELDFMDFCKIADLMQSQKKHLTKEGLEEIKLIKQSMNKGRIADVIPKD